MMSGLLLAAGCKDILPDVEITGSIDVSGDMPSAFSFEVYSALDNTDAFDPSYCEDVETTSQCYGRVRLNKLGDPAPMGEPELDGTNFVLPGIDADVGYILVVGSDDPNVLCNTDIIGFEEPSKVVTEESAISLKFDGDLRSFELPRKVKLDCFTVSDTPDVPEQEDPEVPPDDGDIQPPAVVEWTSFTITGKNGAPLYADASGDSVPADVACDANFPSVLEVHGELAGATEAYIRIQFGSGADAQYRTFPTPVVNGVVNQEITLTGGYAVVQLDTNADLDGVGESNTITFCEAGDRPVQEFMMILTWDKDDTDVDSHVFAAGEEVAYYNLNTSWGMLDIDDIDGFGPETVTSDPDVSGEVYDVRIHYYSDHGNGSTNVTVRVVYVDPEGGVCDVTATRTMSSYENWDVGTFAPGLCPN